MSTENNYCRSSYCQQYRDQHGLLFNQMDHLSSPRRTTSANPTNGHRDAPTRQCHLQHRDVVTSLTINETELGELKSSSAAASPEIIDIAPSHGVPCHNGACGSTSDLKGGRRFPEHRLESPWHHLKTFFLVSMIVALIVWIVIYVLLSQYGIVY